MKKNISIPSRDLINDSDYLNQLKIEAALAGAFKGGHFPFYLKENRLKSLTSTINLLSEEEKNNLATRYFISAN